ncbi:MAG: hypothetical protein KKB38_20260 [Gammaproteobacteria bacterium]|nr:hypothetical protein [Gammaproteobacteria bacterium]
MAKQTTFDHPPGKHIALLAHDLANDIWRAVRVSEDGQLSIDVAVDTSGLLTELGLKLNTTDLNLDATKDLQVDVKTAPTTAVTVSDGADIAEGAVADSVVAAGAVGTLSAKLRRLTTDLDALLTELRLKADLTETQPVSIATMPTTTVQSSGGDKLFGFESIVEEALSNTNLSAGTTNLIGTAVPSGKIWYITAIVTSYVGTTPTFIRLSAKGLAGTLFLLEQKDPVSNQWYIWAGQAYVQEGDQIQCTIVGATAGDDLYCRYAGVQMDAP